MHGFIDSFSPIIKRYKAEVVLLSCALLIAFISLIIYIKQPQNIQKNTATVEKTQTRTKLAKNTITIDIGGAVKKPFVYTLAPGNRIIDAVQMAGGLSDECDEAFVRRNINFARVLQDQEKIYIPSLIDISNGIVLENKRLIDYTQPNTTSTIEPSTRININAASQMELDQLPGIGKVTADAIIANRPYSTLVELVTREIIKQSVYDKIESLISVY